MHKKCGPLDAAIWMPLYLVGTKGAEAATLAIMAGGLQDVFDKAVPVFAPMGRAVQGWPGWFWPTL